MLRRIKEKIAASKLKKKVDASMGLKLVVVMTCFVSLLMVVGTSFVAQTLRKGEYRSLETRGRELGQFLGKAGSDFILDWNLVALDSLVDEVAKSKDVLYAVVTDANGAALSTSSVSFNRDNPDVKALMTGEGAGDVFALIAKVRRQFDVLEVAVEINPRGTKLGTVTMGFATSAVEQDIRHVVFLLLGTSVGIVLLLSFLLYVMSRKMIVAPTKEAVAVASNIAAGDLRVSVHVKSVDELGMLGRGLNRMIIGLKGMIENVRKAAGNSALVWKEVQEKSSAIADGSRVQAESVEEAASSVNEMHYSLKEIAGNVEDIYETSEQTSSSVIEMAASIQEVALTMSELSSSIEETVNRHHPDVRRGPADRRECGGPVLGGRGNRCVNHGDQRFRTGSGGHCQGIGGHRRGRCRRCRTAWHAVHRKDDRRHEQDRGVDGQDVRCGEPPG